MTTYEYLKTNILPKLNYKAVQTMIGNANSDFLTQSYFDDFYRVTNLKPQYKSEELRESINENLTQIKSFAKKLKTTEALKGKRELPYSEMVNINVGDYVCNRDGSKFTKGVVKKIQDNHLILTSQGKDLKVEKSNTIKFFPGQKYDTREITFSLLDLKLTRTNDKKIDFTNVFRNYNLNSVFLKFSDLDSKNRLKLLKGQETGVLSITSKIEQDGHYITKIQKMRFKAYFHDGKVNLQKIEGISAKQNKIYGYSLTETQINKIKSGETLILKELLTKNGNKFNVAAFYDKGLDAFRTKSLNEKPLEKLRILGNRHLTTDELKILNNEGQLKVNHTNKKGVSSEYLIKYDLPLNKVSIGKLKNENQKNIDFSKKNDVSENELKNKKEKKPDISNKNKKKKGPKL